MGTHYFFNFSACYIFFKIKISQTDLLAVWKRSGNSFANFSSAISAMGPNKTIGLLKPAEMRKKRP